MRRVSGGHGAFQWPWLLTPSVLPDFGITDMSHLYTHTLSLAHEILRGYTSIKIYSLTQKVRPRHKSGVSNCALGSAILLSPRCFGTAGGHHENFCFRKEYGFEVQVYSKSEWNQTKILISSMNEKFSEKWNFFFRTQHLSSDFPFLIHCNFFFFWSGLSTE